MRELFCGWIHDRVLKEIIFLNLLSLGYNILNAKPWKIVYFSLSGWQPLVVCGPLWVEGVLESKWLENKLLQSGLMREERRPATGRKVGHLDTMRH